MGFFEDTIRGLDEAGVRYVVVGGLAVVLHGHIRATYDLDLIVDLEEAQARKAVDALTGLGLVPRLPLDATELADAAARSRWISEKFWDPADATRSVDVFVEEPIAFEGLWARSVVMPLASTRVRVASIPDLIELKRGTGRPSDLADIEALTAILEDDG